MQQLPTDVMSAERLTEIFRRSGRLPDGRVAEVRTSSTRDTILSRIIRLHLTYEGETGDLPSSVIVKTGNPARANMGWNAGRHEVTFYTTVAAQMTARLVPYCFEGHHDAQQKSWHLVLEDLTDTHVIAAPSLPPSAEQCRAIVAARARFHAAWWNDPRLGVSIGTLPDAAAENAFLERLSKEIDRFVDRLADRLPQSRRELYGRLLAAAPKLLERTRSRRDLTIVQWDAHVWNCFLPKDASKNDVRIFDWDSWRIDTATDDLAYMMAIWWYPDQRRSLERPLLAHYRETLSRHGVDYAREKLDEDYRLSVLWHITTPVWQAAYDIPPGIWWNNLQRVFMAADEHACGELLT